MKKVMIGILILIPVLILVIVAAVSNFLKIAAWIAVDDISVVHKEDQSQEAESITVVINPQQLIYDVNDYVKVKVFPEYANRYTIEWRISGDVECFDKEYDASEPAAMFVDDNGNEVSSNTSGKFKINSDCRFTVVIQVENVSKTLDVMAMGYNVDSIEIVNVGDDDNELAVGEKMLVDAKYNPISSKVTQTRWHSDNPSVASVDQNGVITALAVGTANITVEANRYYNQDVFVTSKAYQVKVVGSASKFGLEFSTSKNNFTLTEVGIASKDVNAAKSDGCTISGDIVSLTANVAHIFTSKGTVTVRKCAEDDIVIENSDVYDTTSGYVFAVSDLTLKLKAVWADVLKSGEPEVVWSADAEKEIASVTAGEVTAKDVGTVKIIATRNGKSASVTLNLQVKLVSMTLRTNDEYYKVGLAQETVFASEKYRFENVAENNDKEPNSTLIQVIGAPKRADGDTDAAYAAKLEAFYNTFNFRVIEGGEFAYFYAGSSEPNRLIFKPSALDGKGRQSIKVEVSAKYPRYESSSSLTVKTVTINVIHGVEVKNIAEFRQAAIDQETYARAEGNLQPSEQVWEHINTSDGRTDKYKVFNAEYSLYTYAMSVTEDLTYEIQPDGTPLPITGSNNVSVFGDIYGNGHRLSAERNQVLSYHSMLNISWSHVTVSNFNMRANRMDQDGTLSTDETSSLQGECIQIFKPGNKARLIDVRIEFGILENAKRAGLIYNGDCVFDGMIIRNINSTALYNPARMNVYEEDGELVTYPMYPHVTMNNCVFSNCIQTIGSYAYERFSVVPATGDDGNLFPDCKAGDGRFIRKDKAANAEYFEKHFASAGINIQIRQTGFLDVYNWQNVNTASLIDVGDPDTNKLIASFAGAIIKANPTFEQCRYEDKEENATYLHMGFMSSGVSFGQGIFDEPCYLDVTFEDTRFADPIRTKDMPLVVKDNIVVAAAEATIKKFEIVFYGYSAEKSDITPYSAFEINNSFIARLHGEKTA